MYLTDAQGQIVKEFAPIHDATTGDDDEVFDLMARYLDQLDLSGLERVVVCGDGARWIWLRVESLIKNRGVVPENLYQVVDYTHAKQNLQEIVALVPLKKQKRLPSLSATPRCVAVKQERTALSCMATRVILWTSL